MNLSLRRVRPDDVDLLYEWANDPEVRQNAFNTARIPYESHVRWFAGLLADASAYQYILCDGGVPVGQIRLNIEDGNALIDYSVSAGNRGKGYGSQLLGLIRRQVSEDRIQGVIKLMGRVKPENAASARAFEKNGFEKSATAEYLQYDLLL